jgi:hypothetical protein
MTMEHLSDCDWTRHGMLLNYWEILSALLMFSLCPHGPRYILFFKNQVKEINETLFLVVLENNIHIGPEGHKKNTKRALKTHLLNDSCLILFISLFYFSNILTFYIASITFYYYSNKKITTKQNFFIFPYQIFLLLHFFKSKIIV